MSSNTSPLSENTLEPNARTSISSAITNLIIDGDPSNSSFLIKNNENNSMYIDQYSNVSINHTAPIAQFDINSANGACLLLRYNKTTNLSTFYMSSAGKLSINASGGEINTASIIKTTSVASSTSTSTGAVVVSGGMGVGENLYIGGNLVVSGSSNITASMSNKLNENVFIVNNTATTVSNDCGLMMKRYQVSNDNGTGDVVSDTAKYSTTLTGATTNTFVLDTGASAVDDYYKNWWIKITSNGATDNVRKVTGYVGSSRTITIDSVFSSTPTDGSSVNLYNKSYPLIGWQESSNKLVAAFTTTESNVLSIIDYADMVVNGLSIASNITIGSTIIDETDIGKIDGITNGTAAASKAVVLDASRNIATIGNITSDGVLTLQNATDSSSISTGGVIVSGGVGIAKKLYIGDNVNIATGKTLTIGSTVIDETDIGKIDGVTNGTAAASKAVVLDASRNIATVGNITSDGVLTLQNATDASSTSTGGVIISGGVGIAKKLYVGTDINITGSTKIGGTTVVDSSRNATFTTVTTTTEAFANSSTKAATTEYVHNEFIARSSAMAVPTGFENTIDSTIAYNPTTRVLSISPASTSFYVWVSGVRYTISTTQTTSAHPTTTAVTYYYYFDDTGTLTYSTAFPTFYNKAMVSSVYYYDSTHTIFTEERHGTIMDPATHVELHYNIGTYYISGLALDGYSILQNSPTDAMNTFSIDTGIISDEQLNSTIAAVADAGPYSIFYMTGATAQWTWTTGNIVPYSYTAASYINYNQWTGTTWQLTDVASNNKWINYYILFTPSFSADTQVLIIPGQAIYSSLATAQAENFYNLSLGSLPIPEYLPLYQITFRTAAYTTTGKCRIESVTRIVGTRASIINNVATNHQALSGLQIAGTGNTYGHINDQVQTIAGAKTFSDTTNATTTATGAVIVGGGMGIANDVFIGGNVNIATSKTLTIGSTVIDETDIGKIDGVTNGTAAASKAVVLDASRNIATIGNITSDGVLTLQNTTDSSTTSTGGVIISGGVGIAKKLFVGTSVSTNKLLIGGTSSTYLSVDGIGSESLVKLSATTLNNTSATGTDAIIRSGHYIAAPTLTSTNAITTTTAATCYISGAPMAGANNTITNAWALYVNGTSYLNGDVNLTGSISNGTTALMNSSGVLQVAGQTNITSVGTLTGLAISSTSSHVASITNTASTGLADITFNAQGSTSTELGIRGSTVAEYPNCFYIYRGTFGMIMDATGKVAIGEKSPAYKLDVVGDINCSGSVYVAGTKIIDATGSITAFSYYTATGAFYAATSTSTISSSRCSEYAFQIRNGDAASTNIQGISFECGTTSAVNTSPTATITAFRTTGYTGGLIFSTKSTNTATADCTERIRISAAGYLGIANNNPVYPLDVTGDISLSGSIRNGTTALMNSSGVLQVAGQTNITSVGTLTGLVLSSASNDVLTIANTSSSQLANIKINAQGATSTEVGVRGSTSSEYANCFYIWRGVYNMIMDSSGKTAIGAKTPAYPLDVVGDISLSGSLRNAATVFMNSSGVLQVAGQTGITSVGTLTGLTSSGAVSITSTTDSSSKITGALIVSGGVGIAKNLYVGTKSILGGTAISYLSANAISTESYLNVEATTLTNTSAAGTDSIVRAAFYIDVPTFTSTNAITTTTSATVYIAGPPTAGTNQTLTNKYALNIAAGDVKIGSATEATNYNVASITTAGGIGAAKTIWTNTNVLLAGNIGIGTNTPSFKIHMKGTAGNQLLSLYANGNTSADDFYGFGANNSVILYHSISGHDFYMGTKGDGTGGTKYMTLANTGLGVSGNINAANTNVGVSSLSSAYGIISMCNSTVNGEGQGIAFITEGTGLQLNTTPTASIRCIRSGGWGAGSLAFATKASTTQTGALVDRLTISSAGDVSITSTTESSSTTTGALVVAGGIGIAKSLDVGTDITAGTNINCGGSYKMDTVDVIDSNKTFVGSGGVNTTGQMFIYRDGFGLIHHGTVGGALESVSLTTQTHSLGGVLGTNSNHALYFITNNAFRMQITAGGYIYVGGSGVTPASPLEVGIYSQISTGVAFAQLQAQSTPATYSATPSGNYSNSIKASAAVTAGQFVAISDRRIKQDIESIPPEHCIDFINNIRPVKYRLRAEENELYREFGYIAQELCGYSCLVHMTAQEGLESEEFGDPENVLLSVNYEKVVPLLHGALRQTIAKNEELQTTVNNQQTAISRLESNMEMLVQHIVDLTTRLNALEQ